MSSDFRKRRVTGWRERKRSWARVGDERLREHIGREDYKSRDE